MLYDLYMGNVKQKQAKKRNEIMEKILPLLGDVPFEELSMKEICEVADISIGSFYHYFTRKEDLFIALLNIIDEYMESEAFPKMKKKDEIENIRIFAHTWLKYIQTHGLERSKLISAAPVTDFTNEGQPRSSFTKLEAHIKAGQEKGQIRTDMSSAELTEMFFIFIRGLGVDWTRRNASYDLQVKGIKYFETIIDTLKKK